MTQDRRLAARNALFDSGRGLSASSVSVSDRLHACHEEDDHDDDDDDACSCASTASYHTVAEEVDLFPYFELDPVWLRGQGKKSRRRWIILTIHSHAGGFH